MFGTEILTETLVVVDGGAEALDGGAPVPPGPLARPVRLVGPDGSAFSGAAGPAGPAGPKGDKGDPGEPGVTSAATASALGLVKQAAAVAPVAAADAAAAASETVSKAEFDAAVAVANETKKQLNALIASLAASGTLA